MSDEYTPTRSEIERAWAMRQLQLDEEAGRETDGLRYAAETRRAFKEFEAAIRRDQIEKDRGAVDEIRRSYGPGNEVQKRLLLRVNDALRAQIGDTNE